MPLPLTLLRKLEDAAPADAWAALFEHAWSTCSAPLSTEKTSAEVIRRDRELGAADLFLATAGWDLWSGYESSIPRTANHLASWWAARPSGRAVLILDALSLREVPWLLQGAKNRGYAVHQARATGAELPADTTPFANALGFGTRSAIQNNGAPATHRLPGAVTDATDLPWEDCAAQVNAAPDWVLWHHWPDARLHDLGAPGHGVAALTDEACAKLSADSFWNLVHRLSTGRRLVITSDHGYAASGLFPDTVEAAQAAYLKDRFKSGRWTEAIDAIPAGTPTWVPPIDIDLTTQHGEHAFVLGRRKWKSQGGYPTLTHGGLTLLEVAVPFVELSRTGGA